MRITGKSPFLKTRESSSLVKDMLETPALLRGFEPARVGPWAQALGKKKNILVTGEG